MFVGMLIFWIIFLNFDQLHATKKGFKKRASLQMLGSSYFFRTLSIYISTPKIFLLLQADYKYIQLLTKKLVTFSFITPRSDQIQLLYEIETNIKTLHVFPKKYLNTYIVIAYLESKSSLKWKYCLYESLYAVR